MTRKIVTACGLACSMAPLIATKIAERLKEEGINDIQIVAAKVPELESVASDALCVVTTIKVWDDLGVPVIDGSEFVLGGDGKATLDKVISIVNG